MKIKIIPCICCELIDETSNIYDGMPQLRVTNYNKSCDTQYYEVFCPKCGRGGMLQFKSTYLALKYWNKMQKMLRKRDKKMKVLVDRNQVLNLLSSLGGTDASDEYSKGWDEAIEAAYNGTGDLPSVESFTKEELCTLSFGLGVASSFIELKNVNFNSIMEKINRMMEV